MISPGIGGSFFPGGFPVPAGPNVCIYGSYTQSGPGLTPHGIELGESQTVHFKNCES